MIPSPLGFWQTLCWFGNTMCWFSYTMCWHHVLVWRSVWQFGHSVWLFGHTKCWFTFNNVCWFGHSMCQFPALFVRSSTPYIVLVTLCATSASWWVILAITYIVLQITNRIKWVPENLYTFSMAGYIVNVYKFSGTHFNFYSEWWPVEVFYGWLNSE